VIEPAPRGPGLADARKRPHQLIALTVARLRMFVREPGALFWTFGFPILLTVALGIAFRNRPPEAIDVGAVDGGAACAVLGKSADQFKCESFPDEESARTALRTGKVALVVLGGAPRTYLFDPTRPETRLARLAVDDFLQRAAGRSDAATVADRAVTDPGSRYIDFLVPGLIGMNLLSSGMWGVGYLIVEMRSRKLIKRMVATPMRRANFLISFVLMRMLFLLLELPVLLSFAHFAFGVTVRGSLALFFAVAVLGAVSFAGLGLLAASRTESTSTANGLMNLVMLPMMMCSGVFFSTQHFPHAVQPVLRLLPLTALNDALRAIANEGAGARAVAAATGVMALWGVVSLVVALRLFRWR
jgi:ABC-type multidrug transport system permease subunit